MVREALETDIPAICGIYNHYILNTCVTFETEPVGHDEMKNRVTNYSTPIPWLVYEDEGEVVGYAYASQWKARPAYDKSAETTIYLRKDKCGAGIGKRLYAELLTSLAGAGYHIAVGGICVPNDASIRLHKSFGYEKVARFREIGRKFEQWLDVEYYQLALAHEQGDSKDRKGA